jgi:hypothetical protein
MPAVLYELVLQQDGENQKLIVDVEGNVLYRLAEDNVMAPDLIKVSSIDESTVKRVEAMAHLSPLIAAPEEPARFKDENCIHAGIDMPTRIYVSINE